MKELLKTKYIVLALSVVILILSNPSERKFRENFVRVLFEKVAKETPSTEIDPTTMGLAMALLTPIINNAVHSNNYILFSTCEVTWMGTTKTIGVGVLGMTFLYDASIEEFK